MDEHDYWVSALGSWVGGEFHSSVRTVCVCVCVCVCLQPWAVGHVFSKVFNYFFIEV